MQRKKRKGIQPSLDDGRASTIDTRLEYWNIVQVMEATGLGRNTVLRALARQELQGFKVGRRLLFSPEDVRDWIEAKAA